MESQTGVEPWVGVEPLDWGGILGWVEPRLGWSHWTGVEPCAGVDTPVLGWSPEL